jgi:prepilin-type N-terminal cleavage/methylation domain-containing protein/prepilin-type processing-associated H-X9-DG protein
MTSSAGVRRLHIGGASGQIGGVSRASLNSEVRSMRPGSRTVRPSSRGFTLIELLVVVAIIALLISVLLPSLGGARKSARQLQCLTNLSSIGKAALFYQQEFKGWVIANESQEGYMPLPGTPRGYPRDDSYSHTQFAISLLNGLLYDHPVKGLYRDRNQNAMVKACSEIPQLQCPSHPNPKQKLDYIVNGFVQNYTVENCQRDQGDLKFRDRNDVEGASVVDITFFHRVDTFRVDPGRRVYVMEGHKGHSTTDLRFHDAFYTTHLPFAGSPRMANDKRHPKGTNVLFFDGHAVRMNYPEFDAGWPNSIGVRLRWFSDAPERYR